MICCYQHGCVSMILQFPSDVLANCFAGQSFDIPRSRINTTRLQRAENSKDYAGESLNNHELKKGTASIMCNYTRKT